MEHLAILGKEPLEKILSGEKIIESRWYEKKIAPFNKIKNGDKVYFKESGKKSVTASGITKKVLFIDNLDESKIIEIYETYGKGVCFSKSKEELIEMYKKKKYCILIFLKDVRKLTKPFIVKRRYGTAWITVDNIDI